VKPPYPADTRAKGWRFELDYEQIEQSDTWGVTKPEARPWLLMLWMTAWKQVPCGSMPADHEVIVGKLGMPDDLWEKHKGSLLRGWVLADDGRLYHDTLTARVLEMMSRRRSESDRKARGRAKVPADSAPVPPDVPELSRGTDAGLHPESGTDHRPPTTLIPSSPAGQKVARKRATPPECPAGVDAQVWTDWLALRAKKRAPVTATVLDGVVTEAAKAGMNVEAFLRIWCRRGTQGLEADWLKPQERQAGAPAETAYARQMREKYEQVCPDIAAKRPGATNPYTVDMEPANAIAIR
jgi:hypothetical protein